MTKQTTAVLKSTGGIAGVTARQVDELSTSVSRRTDLRPHALDRRAGNAAGIDDEAIRSGENLLLTLTNVVRAEGLRPWLWTVDPEDWRPGATPDRIQAVAGGAAGADVVLPHDWVEQPWSPAAHDWSATVTALPGIVTAIRGRTLDRLRP